MKTLSIKKTGILATTLMCLIAIFPITVHAEKKYIIQRNWIVDEGEHLQIVDFIGGGGDASYGETREYPVEINHKPIFALEYHPDKEIRTKRYPMKKNLILNRGDNFTHPQSTTFFCKPVSWGINYDAMSNVDGMVVERGGSLPVVMAANSSTNAQGLSYSSPISGIHVDNGVIKVDNNVPDGTYSVVASYDGASTTMDIIVKDYHWNLRLEPNGGEGTPRTFSYPCEVDPAQYTIPKNTFTKTGYRFVGWLYKYKVLSCNEDGSETFYIDWEDTLNDGQKLVNLSGEHYTYYTEPSDNHAVLRKHLTGPGGSTEVYYALWEPVSYRISFSRFKKSLSRYVVYDEEFVMPSPSSMYGEAYNADKIFVGYNTKEDGTGIMYQPGDVVKNLSTVHGGIVEIYDIWTDKKPATETEETAKFKKTTLRINKGNKVSCGFVNNTGKKVAYKSSNTKVVTVDSKGNLTAKGKGKATISAKVDGKTYKCTVYVYNPTISGKSQVTKGKSITLKVKDGYGKTTWKSSNKKIATIDKNGKVKGIKKGKVTITAKNNGKTIKKTIQIK